MDLEKVLFQLVSMKVGEVLQTSVGDVTKTSDSTFSITVSGRHHRITAEQLQIEATTEEELFP